MEFRNYKDEYYNDLCDFLIELNRYNKLHVNWNWARFEWMAEHPEFDKENAASIGLWYDNGIIVGAAIYDMYFGEGFCAVLPGYEALYAEVLEYACSFLGDDDGFALALNDKDASGLEAVMQAGFHPTDQYETVMSLDLENAERLCLPEDIHIEELDPAKQAYDFQWLLWQGFDHGTDRQEFECTEAIVPQIRKHLYPRLSLAAVSSTDEKAGYCCLWHSSRTDYAYIEPVCTVPSYRGRGIAGALLCEDLRRASELGAKRAYVISDISFYEKLGFRKDQHYTFFRRKKGE